MKKNLKYYLSLKYPITVDTYLEDGEARYSLEIPDLPGCGAGGETIEEAMKKLEDAKELWIAASLKRNLDIPEPVSEKDFSGRFLLRIPTRLHMALTRQAKKEGQSLNQYVRSILEWHMYRISGPETITIKAAPTNYSEEELTASSSDIPAFPRRYSQTKEQFPAQAAGGV
jgi:antitoxin HicB